MNTPTKENCEICFKIICKSCKWEASEVEIIKIRDGELTSCPICGWKPGKD